jgi:hypothetical protein
MAIATGTLLLAGAGIGSALLGARGAKKAANAQVASTEQATAEQRRQFDLSRADFAPWQQAGASAIGSLSDMLKPGYDHTTSPGYQFRFNEGQRAVDSSGAARGQLMSGGTLKDLARFGQGIASDDFNQQFNRTASVAQGGQQANTTLGQLGANAATNIGNNFMQAGNARASGYAGQTAAFQNGLSNLAFLGMNGGFGGGGQMPTSGWGNPGLY